MKRRRWIWIAALALLLLAVAAYFAGTPPDPVMGDFQRLAEEHGLEPLDPKRLYFAAADLTPDEQRTLAEEFRSLGVRSGLQERGTSFGSAGGRFSLELLRVTDDGSLRASLEYGPGVTTLALTHRRTPLTERVRGWFRGLSGP